MVLRGSPGTMSSQTLRKLASFQKSVSKASAWDIFALPVFRPVASAVLRNLLYSIINFPDLKIKPAGNPDAQAQAARYRESRRDRHPHACRRTLRHAWRRRL